MDFGELERALSAGKYNEEGKKQIMNFVDSERNYAKELPNIARTITELSIGLLDDLNNLRVCVQGNADKEGLERTAAAKTKLKEIKKLLEQEIEVLRKVA